jgi:predicted HicB family RNase H-like nuclease
VTGNLPRPQLSNNLFLRLRHGVHRASVATSQQERIVVEQFVGQNIYRAFENRYTQNWRGIRDSN